MSSSRLMKRLPSREFPPCRVCAGLAVATALLFAAGCQRKAPLIASPTPRTPAEKLDAMAVGLENLLDNLPSAEGVTVKSKITHRLITPTGVDAAPEAEITIETNRFFVLAPQAMEPAEEPNPPEVIEDKLVEAEVEADTAIVKNSEKKVYQLAYLDDRWQLRTELSDVSEQILFDRALRMQ